jgi:cation:H+ antiporter
MFLFLMNAAFNIVVIIASSIFIFFLGEKFAAVSSRMGDYFRLSKAVKGATFDAIASSLPELLVALFSVIFFHEFEVGIGTIAGSALFNLLVIPGVCVLVSPKIFQVSREVIDRDALFYIVSVFILLVLTLYFKFWGVLVAIFLILVYFYYISEIIYDTKKSIHRRVRPDGINLPREIFSAFVLLGGIGIATYFLTDASIKLASVFGVAPVIIAFTITAAATSVPDTVLSVVNARKGDLDDAASNVFGSNIFNILFGLGFPLLLYSMIKGKLEIVFGHVEIIIGLMGSTIMLLYFFARREMISKKKGLFLILLYVLFVIYVALIG